MSAGGKKEYMAYHFLGRCSAHTLPRCFTLEAWDEMRWDEPCNSFRVSIKISDVFVTFDTLLMYKGAHYNSASVLDGLPLTHNKKNRVTHGAITQARDFSPCFHQMPQTWKRQMMKNRRKETIADTRYWTSTETHHCAVFTTTQPDILFP